MDKADWDNLKDTLDTLYLGENSLSDIPEVSLESLRQLTLLSLDHNNFRVVQTSHLAKSLRSLSVQNNLLTEVPRIDPLTRLTAFSLRGNLLRSIPSYTLTAGRHIDKLDLGQNLISSFRTFYNGSLVIRDINMDLNIITNLHNYSFYGTGAGRVILSLNKIENISETAFAGLEMTLEYLDLEGNKIRHFPRAIQHLKMLKYLYLSSNMLTNLEDSSLEGISSTLKVLSLSGNKFFQVPQIALESCVKLTHLNLGYNFIKELISKEFIGWSENIETLILQNNMINKLSNNIFNHTSRLRELSLSFNRLIEIEVDAFTDLGNSLESLEMSFALQRDDFPVEELGVLTSLVWLALDNNNVRYMSRSALISFSRLQYLNLESNKLTELVPGTFNGTKHMFLKEVRLSYNYLNNLYSNTFSGLEKLQSIMLDGNNIRVVHTGAFRNMPNLVKIALSQNRINNLNERAFTSLEMLKKVDLQMNELREFSLSTFENVSITFPMALNLSRNEINVLNVESWLSPINLGVLDVSHNRLSEVPTSFLNLVAANLTNLNLGYNIIYQVPPFSFSNLSNLLVLNMEHNGIISIRRKAFSGLSSLQLLDLSHNHLKYLQVSQFTSCSQLRVLDLSSNHIRNLPRDVFKNTLIEGLDLSNNEFVIFPSQALGDIGFTIRNLDLSFNQIDHVDSTMFYETQFLTSLNLCQNKLSILPDNVFTSLGNLINLRLCRNTITANFKELFHYIPKLQSLDLSFLGLKSLPNFPLSKLTHLNVSGNYIESVPVSSIESLSKLRTFLLHKNKLSQVPSKCWTRTPLLKELDISSNPIKVSQIAIKCTVINNLLR